MNATTVSAVFAIAGTPQITVRCDRNNGTASTLTMTVHAWPALSPMVVHTHAGTDAMTNDALVSSSLLVWDRIASSRGRFALQSDMQMMRVIVPLTAEPIRVIEECRRASR